MRALLQARDTTTKGGQSATQMYANAQYLLMAPIIAMVDFEAQGHHLVREGHPKRLKWLMQNAVVVRLVEAKAFYLPQTEVGGPPSNTLFVRHLSSRRAAAAEH